MKKVTFVHNAILLNRANPECVIVRSIVGETKSVYECDDDLEEDLKKSQWKIIGQAYDQQDAVL